MNPNLKQARESKNLTQAELARRAGINQSYLSLAEADTRILEIDNMIVLEQVLNTPIAWRDDFSQSEKIQVLQAMAGLASHYPMTAVLDFAKKILIDRKQKGPVQRLAVYAQIATRGSEESLLPLGVE